MRELIYALQSSTVSIPDAVHTALKDFRKSTARKTGICVQVFKVNMKTYELDEVERFDDISIDELVEELPENSPRFVVMSYEFKYRDGRTSSKLILVNWVPPTSEPRILTLHTTASLEFQKAAEVDKVIEVHEGSEGLTKEVLDAAVLA
ncbi:actin depolymerizing protein [Fistulina hepatica ATCC 64428]|nr:actin depolymerizing protein [Fistulina hepatica ATCC 64428]